MQRDSGSISEILLDKDDTERDISPQQMNRSIHSTNLPGLNAGNFNDVRGNEEEKQVAKSVIMNHNEDQLNLSDNTREMVKQPEHLEQMVTNNIDEMERLLQQIDGAGSGSGGNAAPVSASVGGANGAVTNNGPNSQINAGGQKDTTSKAPELLDDDETEGNMTRLVEKLE